MKLRNRVVVITGAASGIGRASARRFAERGAVLHLIDIDRERLESAALECGRLGARATWHPADCRDPAAMRAVAAEVLDQGALIDVLFLNAGVGYGGPIADMSLDDWRFVLDTNLYGVVHGLDAFLGPILAQGPGGHLLITASMLGLYSLPSAGAYAASKHALIALADSLRAELRGRGVEVTALCPGLIASDIIARGRVQNAGLAAGRLARLWSNRGADPDRVARVALACVEKRRGGIRLAAPTGTALWHLRRYAPPLYDRLLFTSAAALAFARRRSAAATRP
jgi:NAD(P)-dependent dehydrogenase (short-subunit alcohol dehydrogenase family)